MAIKIKKLIKNMKKIVKIIEKSNEIKKRIVEKVKGRHEYNTPGGPRKHHDHDKEDDELDDHNDPSNWSYA